MYIHKSTSLNMGKKIQFGVFVTEDEWLKPPSAGQTSQTSPLYVLDRPCKSPQQRSFQRLPPRSPASLVIKNIILGQRAAVYVSHSSLRGRSASVLEGTTSVPLGAGRGGNAVGHRRTDQVGRPVFTIRLCVDAVQVVRNAEAAAIQQELGQEVVLCSWGGTRGASAGWTLTNNYSPVLSGGGDFWNPSHDLFWTSGSMWFWI